MYQTIYRLRDQFKSTEDQEVRAVTMARVDQRDINPAVDAQLIIVDGDACTVQRTNYVTKMAEQKRIQEKTQAAVLLQ